MYIGIAAKKRHRADPQGGDAEVTHDSPEGHAVL